MSTVGGHRLAGELLGGLLLLGACQPSAAGPPSSTPTPTADTSAESAGHVDLANAPASPPEPETTEAPPVQLEPDGSGAVDPSAGGPFPAAPSWQRVGRHWGALTRICDMQPHGGFLYLAHATRALGWDGATLTRHAPHLKGKSPFELAFDWNRPGQPTRGGGGGQGFLRIRDIGERLFVPDADPPYLGFGFRHGIEGYVFVSNSQGKFARARHPKLLPPTAPTADRAGAAVLPRAFHSFDVIVYRGRYYVTAGIDSKDGQARGALLSSKDGHEFDVAAEYPSDPAGGVWRLTYAVRYRDRLLTGLETLGRELEHDYLVWTLSEGASALSQQDARPVRATKYGGAATIRWYADSGRLYWIARDGSGSKLRFTEDGESWHALPLPMEAGAPTDILRYRGNLVVLCEHGLFRLDGSRFELVAPAPDGSAFAVGDHYCAAPLAVFEDTLFAGGQKKGNLYRLVETEPQTTPMVHPGDAERAAGQR